MNNTITINEPVVLAEKTRLLPKSITVNFGEIKNTIFKFDVVDDEGKDIGDRNIVFRDLEHNELVTLIGGAIMDILTRVVAKTGVPLDKITIPTGEEIMAMLLNPVPEPEPTPDPEPVVNDPVVDNDLDDSLGIMDK